MKRVFGSCSGFEEIPHTADWALRVWAPDAAGLLRQAARGMYSLMGLHYKPQKREACSFTLEGMDRESLLVAFLSELLYYIELKNTALDGFKFHFQDGSLSVEAWESDLSGPPQKEIKAVTYNDLEIRETPDGLETTLVFDV